MYGHAQNVTSILQTLRRLKHFVFFSANLILTSVHIDLLMFITIIFSNIFNYLHKFYINTNNVFWNVI